MESSLRKAAQTNNFVTASVCSLLIFCSVLFLLSFQDLYGVYQDAQFCDEYITEQECLVDEEEGYDEESPISPDMGLRRSLQAF